MTTHVQRIEIILEQSETGWACTAKVNGETFSFGEAAPSAAKRKPMVPRVAILETVQVVPRVAQVFEMLSEDWTSRKHIAKVIFGAEHRIGEASAIVTALERAVQVKNWKIEKKRIDGQMHYRMAKATQQGATP